MQKVHRLNSEVRKVKLNMTESVNMDHQKSRFKLIKRILFAFVIMMACGVGYGLYKYYAPVQSLKNADADITIKATDLFDAYLADENEANKKYLNKVIEVSGTINEVSKDANGFASIYLQVNGMMGSVSCAMDSVYAGDVNTLKKGQEIKVKGKCTGYLIDVVLNRCVLSK